jgi:hypothetical protein
MAKPTEIPSWATDVGATNDPGATRKATGFITGKKAPAKWFNHLFNRAGQWCAYLNDLHNEPGFLNKNYAWTGQHSFEAPGGISGGYVDNHWGVNGEVLYVDANGLPTPIGRSLVLPLSGGVNALGTTGVYKSGVGGGYVEFGEMGGWNVAVQLPRGVTMTSFWVWFRNHSASDVTVNATLRRIRANWLTEPMPVSEVVADVPNTTMGAGVPQVFTPASSFAEIVDNETYEYVLTTVTTGDVQLLAMRIHYLDPGPRNV